MTNTTRNTIVLATLLFILGGISISTYQNLHKKATILIEANDKSSKKIEVLMSQISNIDSLKMEYEIRKAMITEQSKVILVNDSPTITYQYLLRMLSWMKKNTVFDFAMSDKDKEGTSWNQYIISGRSNYQDIVDLTRNIEYQRALLTIEEIAIGADNVAHSDTVSFSIVFRTHFNSGGVDADGINPKKMPSGNSSYQLFSSRVYDTAMQDDNLDRGLVSIDMATLVGIANNRIFLRDSQGIIRILAPGDKVAYGFLYNVDVKNSKAVFVIDKYGIPEEQTLFTTNPK
ncbi:MAG: hypothetical protein PHH43_05750 [Candidatus Cloacimonetes bacterium]|nr:hypothetical protein [Candidatus Cloacimonadota bacterium]MDD3235814.1 hypothetical protein [Candidatus Cloacimonadota bacterium]